LDTEVHIHIYISAMHAQRSYLRTMEPSSRSDTNITGSQQIGTMQSC
jgi:hypothetical protein